jgi:hypothetical protein
LAALADGSALEITLADAAGAACPLALAPVRDANGSLLQWLALTRR